MDAICNVVTCEEGFANSFEGIPGDHVYIVNFFWKRVHIVEDSSEVEIFNVDNEQKPVEVWVIIWGARSSIR